MDTFIGIDFSLNSTGICIINQEHNKIISVYKTENNIDKMFSRTDHFSLLRECKEVEMIIENKAKKEDGEYYIRERSKILSFMKLVDCIIESIRNEMNDGNVYIAMEGISFGSAGNSLIDISMATGILRKELIGLLKGDSGRFLVFSPTAIKKFAGKGNFKKIDMFEALLKDTDLNSDFIKLMVDQKDLMITPKGIVKKPIEDMVDSIWVAKFLKDTIVNGKY